MPLNIMASKNCWDIETMIFQWLIISEYFLQFDDWIYLQHYVDG